MTDLFAFLIQQPLLLLAIVAIMLSVAGGMLLRVVPWLGRLLRGIGTLGLTAALLLTIAQAARMSGSSDAALLWAGVPKIEVAGTATRIPMSPDGHFWVEAEVNGISQRFLIDTGATLTALSPQLADKAAIKPGRLDRAIVLQTANGAVAAQTATAETVHFGNVTARNLDVVIAPGMGETSVIGMNLLSRLASWKVEGRTLVLEPAARQGTAE